jgi:hypothetical protein
MVYSLEYVFAAFIGFYQIGVVNVPVAVAKTFHGLSVYLKVVGNF